MEEMCCSTEKLGGESPKENDGGWGTLNEQIIQRDPSMNTLELMVHSAKMQGNLGVGGFTLENQHRNESLWRRWIEKGGINTGART